MHYFKTHLNENQLKFAFSQITTEQYSHLVGTLAHLVYWAVFGGFNDLPIDNQHMELLLKKVLEQLKDIETGILRDFLENPLLANYDVSNLKASDHTHDKGDESARNENIAARVSSIKKKNCETKGKRLS